tara:strand:- start:29263 stop:30135 length:873 start_codon:yes stop_codon:yes gene_type:complete
VKIALIGTSPIIFLIAHKISKKNQVTIFDYGKNYGGAWSWEKYYGKYIPTKTNVIVPANSMEEKSLKGIISYFKKNFKIKPKIIKHSYHTLHSYKPKKVYDFKLHELYKKIFKKKKIKIVKKKIQKIKFENKVVINNKFKFDKIFIPYFAGVREFCINKKKVKINFKMITSKHLLIISTRKLFNTFYYSENFNSFLDRAQLLKKKNHFIFKARIRKKFKSYKKNDLINLLFKKEEDKKKIKLSKIIKYKNFFRDQDQIKELEKVNLKRNAKIIDTSQFVASFLKNKTLIV